MWGGDWNFQAAENIDGINSVIWKYTDRFGGVDTFWLSLHNENWEYFDSGDAGWPGDPRYNESPDTQFYNTEKNFNIDLNKDGRIGPPPNKDPLLTGEKATLDDGQQNNPKTINYWELIQGYTDPEGDYVSIEQGSVTVNNGTINYEQFSDQYTFTPDTDFAGQVDISYNIIDENGGSVSVTNSFNINAPKPKLLCP